MKVTPLTPCALSSKGLHLGISCVAALSLAVATARAADLTWDTSVTAGIQSTSGTWDNGITADWTGDDGASNVVWTNANSDNAIFTTTAGDYTVTLATPTASNISFVGSGVGTVTLASSTLTFGGTMTVAATNNVSISSKLSGTGNISVSGNLFIPVTSTNDFSGGVSLNTGGSVVLRGGSALGSGTLTINGGTIKNDGANANISLSNTIVFSGDLITNSSASITLSGTANLGGVTRNISNNGSTGSSSLVLSGLITNGGINLTGTGSRNVVMNNANNTFAGGVTINSGSALNIKFSSTGTGASVTKGALGTGTFTINGGAVSFDNFSNITVGNNIAVGGDFSLAAGTGRSHTLSGGINLGGETRTITMSSGTGAMTLSGALSNGGLTLINQSGGGVFTLSGTNTYTGATTVSSGTLTLGSAGSLASTAYSVANGAIFNASAKTSYSLASVATTIDVGATTAGFFNGPTGTLTLGNSLTLNFSTASIADGQTYNLMDFGSKSGDFSSVALTGSIIGSLLLTGTDTWTGSLGGYDFTLNEANGNLLVAVSAVPEPSTYAAMFGVVSLAGAVIYRRRTKQA